MHALSLLRSFQATTEQQKVALQYFEFFLQTTGSQAPGSSNIEPVLTWYTQLFLQELDRPYQFSCIHEAEPSYTEFAQALASHFLDLEQATLEGSATIREIQERLNRNENVFLLANHQIELDPQVLQILLKQLAPDLASKIRFVAGDRVVTDPAAICVSRGCNLICVYSKKYIDLKPEKASEYRLHNRRVMHSIGELLSTGGQLIWVAPSGGRDRLNTEGELLPAKPDTEGLELYRHMAMRSSKPTHFYPLAMKTYDILPPPSGIKTQIGEERTLRKSPAHIQFGTAFDLATFPCKESDKKAQREERAAAFLTTLTELYKSTGQTVNHIAAH